MFQFIDNHYRQGIIALKMYHSRKNMLTAGLTVFFLFVVAITIMFIDKGLLMLISLPISFVITIVYLYFVNKSMKKKVMMTKINISKVKVTVDKDNIMTETTFNNQKVVTSTVALEKIIKVVETKDHYFLYDSPLSAVILTKANLITNNPQAMQTFLYQRFKVKKYGK